MATIAFRKCELRLLRFTICGALLAILVSADAQNNLVPNHSFEVIDTCSEVNTWYYPNTGALQWFSASGTDDLFLSCLPDSSFNSVPRSLWAYQQAQDGGNYVGVAIYDEGTGYREYIAVELTAPLQVGQTYYASFFVSPSFGGTDLFPQVWLTSDRIGMRFAMQASQWEFGDPPMPAINQAHVFHPTIVSDTSGWTLVSGSFTADSAYQYILLGNHFDNANTDTMRFGNFPWNPRGHMLIDNVCVSGEATGCPLTNAVEEVALSNVLLYPNPAQTHIQLSGIGAGSRLTIYDMASRKVWESEVVHTPYVIDVQSWDRGTYVMHIWSRSASQQLGFVLMD